MPFLRRGRRRPPFLRTSRWQQRAPRTLRLYLASTVRNALTAWMKIYGDTNNLPGLATGPIEVRFRRLREHAGADVLLLWTTPERWASGEGLSLWIPAIGLDCDCRFDDGRLWVDRARPTTAEERDPRRVRSAVGMELRPELVELPTPDHVESDNGSEHLEIAFERLVGRRWTGFVGPLREALEAEARDDAARAERLTTAYAESTPRIGGQRETDPYRLSGIDGGACAAFEEGEWLDLVDGRGRVISSARLVRADPAEGVLDVDVRGAEPPSSGTVRPRPQTQIFAQKRAILDEFDSPTGGLRDVVRLVASPSSLPPPMKRRPIGFVNKLVMRNRSQVRAVSLALGLEDGQALMVQGPPGTGKSTTLAEILGQLVLRDPNVTVLVCSHSNHGVDNLLLKTLPYLESVPEMAIARVGLFDRVHRDARQYFVPPGEDLGAYNVVFTTVDALALQTEAGARTYDYAVLDEANRASILDSLIPLVRGRRFILVGDHLQLQPVLSEAEEQLRGGATSGQGGWSREPRQRVDDLEPDATDGQPRLRLEPARANNTAIGKSLFTWLRERRFPEAATVFLDEQNRMHPVIAGLISEVFYDGRLRSGPRAPRRAADVAIFPSPVTWVDTRGLHGLREARGRGASLMNVPEARLVATIARHILNSAPRDHRTGQTLDVGVIAAYAEQTALLRRLLRNGAQPKGGKEQAYGRGLEIDTVDAFEGREKDVIIVSLVRSNRRRDIGFLRLMQRINVALSRARRLLIIVGDASTLRGSYFDRILRYVRANGAMVPGPRLIGRLLNARANERDGGTVGRRRRQLPRLAPSRQDVQTDIPPIVIPDEVERLQAESAPGQGAGRLNRRRRRRGRRRPERPTPTAPRLTGGDVEQAPTVETGSMVAAEPPVESVVELPATSAAPSSQEAVLPPPIEPPDAAAPYEPASDGSADSPPPPKRRPRRTPRTPARTSREPTGESIDVAETPSPNGLNVAPEPPSGDSARSDEVAPATLPTPEADGSKPARAPSRRRAKPAVAEPEPAVAAVPITPPTTPEPEAAPAKPKRTRSTRAKAPATAASAEAIPSATELAGPTSTDSVAPATAEPAATAPRSRARARRSAPPVEAITPPSASGEAETTAPRGRARTKRSAPSADDAIASPLPGEAETPAPASRARTRRPTRIVTPAEMIVETPPISDDVPTPPKRTRARRQPADRPVQEPATGAASATAPTETAERPRRTRRRATATDDTAST